MSSPACHRQQFLDVSASHALSGDDEPGRAERLGGEDAQPLLLRPAQLAQSLGSQCPVASASAGVTVGTVQSGNEPYEGLEVVGAHSERNPSLICAIPNLSARYRLWTQTMLVAARHRPRESTLHLVGHWDSPLLARFFIPYLP